MSVLDVLHRHYQRQRLRDPAYAFMYEADRTGELVALDCETTGFDPQRDEIISIAAIKIRGRRLLTGQSLRLMVRPERAPTATTVKVHRLRPMDVAAGQPMSEALPRLLEFIGCRPLVGYYIDFDVRMINKYMVDILGARLANPTVEVSRMYHAYRYLRQRGDSTHRYTGKCDLSFATIRQDLDLPELAQHDAFNDALLAALMYVKLAYRRDG